MSHRPDVSPDDFHFSKTVLVYDESDEGYCELGYFNFDTDQWSHHGDISMNLICWCEIPRNKEYLSQNPNLKTCTHTGYVE